MCEPTTILAAASLAMGAAGTGMSMKAASDQTKARNSAAAAEAARQAGFQDQAKGAFDSSLTQFDAGKQTQNVQDATTQREGEMDKAAQSGAQDYTMPGAPSAPAIIKSDLARAIADGVGRGREDTKRRAALGAAGQSQFGNQLGLARSNEELGKLGDFSGASSGLMGNEMMAANGAGQGWRQGADLANVGGMASGLYGAIGAPGLGKLFGPAPAYGGTGAGKTIKGSTGMLGGGV
jgi:hypothetical protein